MPFINNKNVYFVEKNYRYTAFPLKFVDYTLTINERRNEILN